MKSKCQLMQGRPRPQAPHKLRAKPVHAWGTGDKVLCIDAKGLRRTYVPGPPVEGHLYCVREVYADSGQTGILLVGIRGPALPSNLECGFLARRFRWVHD